MRARVICWPRGGPAGGAAGSRSSTASARESPIGRAITLKAPKKLPRILAAAETQAVLDACDRLRDRFFFALMHETGCRAGEVLGLRHEDIAAAECEVTIVARENANGARAKSGI